MGRHDGHDVVFVSHDGTIPDFVYSHYYQHTPLVTYERGDAVELALKYAKEHIFSGDLPFDECCHILEISSDGWGLFQFVSNPPDQEYWKLVDSYDAIERQERNMADQGYINDVRFGADSDYWDPNDWDGNYG